MPAENQHSSAAPEPSGRPAFLLTIDTEGDNLWSAPKTITTRNSAFQERFQQLCEKHELKPTYVADWEMAECPIFRSFARSVLERGTGEIGMHLHAWNTPPLQPLTDDDFRHMPYLVEYPRAVIREKIARMTGVLEDTLGVKMVSHRAGRWAFDEYYASVLIELGYLVDCSITPHVTWSGHEGVPGGPGGTDYRGFPDEAYWLDLDDVSRPGESGLLEVPVTILRRRHSALVETARKVAGPVPIARRVVKRFFPQTWWLRPTGRNRRQLLATLKIARRQRRDYVEFMLHSSELMPGGSPTFPTSESIEVLYMHLDDLFAAAAEAGFEGLTLQEYYQRFKETRRAE